MSGENTQPDDTGQVSEPYLRPLDRSKFPRRTIRAIVDDPQTDPDFRAALNRTVETTNAQQWVADQRRIRQLMNQYADERDVRITKHLAKLDRLAEKFAYEVLAHRMTMAELEDKFDALACTYDTTMPILQFIVPYKVAMQRLQTKFAEIVNLPSEED